MALPRQAKFHMVTLRNNLPKVCRYQRRALCSLPPLNEPIETSNIIKNPLKAPVQNETVKITTLSNGLKVASENSFGQFSTIGALIDAGSRYEVDYPSGVTHILEKLAFQSTKNFTDNDVIVQKMESLGGHVDCQAFRDCVVYAASALKHNIEGVIEVLSDSIWHSNLTETEIAEQKETIRFELESLNFQPDVEPELTDLIHAAAFNGNTLGLPKLCPAENVDMLSQKVLKHFIQRYYQPERITIAGVNVDHDELVKQCKKFFVDAQPSWLSDKIVSPDASIAQYVGGMLKDHREAPRLQPGITQLPELLHLAIAFQSAKYTEQDMFAFAVLNMLLGGGGSFSAGGPGKGMYSRLYTNVLNQSHWMFASTAFNHSYADSGLFCIHSSAHPSEGRKMMRVITEEYAKLVTEPFNPVEVARAKKQAQSMLMMNLESRIVRFEDIGRQVLGLGKRIPPEELYQSLDAVTVDDLRRISESMLASKPSVAAIGNCASLPDLTYVQDRLYKRTRGSWASSLFN